MAVKPMTKAQLVSLIADKASLTKAAASGILDILSETAVAETKKKGQFVIPGVGKTVKSKRNPQTGATITIPAKTVVKFRVAKAFKDAVIPPKK